MSDLKISELLDGGSANLNDQIAVARTGVNYELTLGEVKVLVLGTIATDVSNNALAITALQGDRLKLDGSNGPMTGNLDMGANKITSTYVPAADADLVNRKYITDNYLPLAGGVMTGAITLHSTGTPGSGSEPVSYTFAEATYAKANGTDGFVARFSPNGTSFAESKIRDDGTTSSINGVVSATDQLKIYSSLDAALNIEASGTKGISILSDFGSDSGFGVSSKVANGATVYALYGALPSTTGTITGNYYGVFATGTHTNAGQTIGGDIYGVYGNARHTAGTFGDGAGNGGDLYGVYGQATYSNTTNAMHSSEKMAALYAYSSVSSGATAANGHGVQSQFDVDGTLTNGYSFYAGSSLSSGEITNYHAFYSNGCKATTCTTAYGIKLDAHNTGANKWGVYQEGVNDDNWFKANTGFGTDAPLAETNLTVTRVSAASTASSNIVTSISGSNTNTTKGIDITASNTSSGTVWGTITDISTSGTSNLLGHEVKIDTSGSSTITANAAYYISQLDAGGTTTVSNAYGLLSNGVGGSGTTTNAYHLYLTAHSSGTNKWGIYEAGGFKNSATMNVFESKVMIGHADNYRSQNQMLVVEANVLASYDDEDIGALSGSVQTKFASAGFMAREDTITAGDYNYIQIHAGQNNSDINCIGVIGVKASVGISNHETDMFLGVRGSGVASASKYQEGIAILSGTSGGTMPRVRFGGNSNGYTFPAARGTAGQRLQTDGSGNLTWVTP